MFILLLFLSSNFIEDAPAPAPAAPVAEAPKVEDGKFIFYGTATRLAT